MLIAVALPTWGIFTPVDPYAYPDNMTMVIQLKDRGQIVDTCEVAAFIGSECRGTTFASDGLYYLLIAGEGSGQKIEIRTCLYRKIVTIDKSIVYVGDQNIGTPWEPYVIDISDVVASMRIDGDCNGDGTVDVADISTIISVMADSEGTNPLIARASDVNGDGRVDVADIASVITIMSSL